jgi:hypothetical protein
LGDGERHNLVGELSGLESKPPDHIKNAIQYCNRSLKIIKNAAAEKIKIKKYNTIK